MKTTNGRTIIADDLIDDAAYAEAMETHAFHCAKRVIHAQALAARRTLEEVERYEARINAMVESGDDPNRIAEQLDFFVAFASQRRFDVASVVTEIVRLVTLGA